jgi:hypothetical protein
MHFGRLMLEAKTHAVSSFALIRPWFLSGRPKQVRDVDEESGNDLHGVVCSAVLRKGLEVFWRPT